jgi:rhodanese-related sulfurtransferase
MLVRLNLTFPPPSAIPRRANAPHVPESGFLKVLPDGTLEMSMSDSVGYASTYTGTVSADGNVITLKSQNISSANANAKKTNNVTRIITFSPEEDSLSYELNMEAVDQPMQDHLKATFKREAEVVDVTAEEFKAHPAKFNFVVDVREPDETGTVAPLPGSIATPLGKMYRSGPAKEWEGKNVLWICKSGRRAELIAKDGKQRVREIRLFSPNFFSLVCAAVSHLHHYA